MTKVLVMRDTEMSDATLGRLFVDGVRVVDTLELPWRENQHNISRIPVGVYPLLWLYSNKHERYLWHVNNVPNRGNVEIHVGNTAKDTEGCILVGESRWINNGATRILGSVSALAELEERLKQYQHIGCDIEIRDSIIITSKTA